MIARSRLHPRRRRPARRLLSGLVILAALCAAALSGSGAAAAQGSSGSSGSAKPPYAEIEGSGSTWSYVILQQWIADVAASGMQVTFNNNGSSQGRKDFANGVTDFGISEIPYQGTDPTTGQSDTSSRPYAYLPIVAGGTSFTYHLTVAGHQVNTLRLSGKTLTEIFTGKISNWNDPDITADNNGHALPSLTIHPVVRADASGTTAQFTAYMANQYPSLWAPFNNGKDALTSQYPSVPNGVKANGSDQVMNTITSANGNGTIGYVEYAYPLNAHYPVVKVENKAGYFVQPTQYNVAVALTQAQINQDKTSQNYLTEILTKVYNYSDPRTYPLSSYSYMIIPTSSTDKRMTSSKRQTLADFLTYDICAGQGKAGAYGYSPLPLNLVQAGFTQISKLKQADPNVDLTNHDATKCDNPTFVAGNLSANHLAQIAPQPAACDKTGEGPCGTSTTDSTQTGTTSVPTNNGTAPTTSTSPGSTTPGSTTPGSTTPGTTTPGSTTPGSTTPGTTTPGSTTPGTTTTDPNAPSGAPSIDPLTGAVTTTSDGTTTTSSGSSDVYANPVVMSADHTDDNKVMGGAVVLELLALVLLPGLYVAWLRRRRAVK